MSHALIPHVNNFVPQIHSKWPPALTTHRIIRRKWIRSLTISSALRMHRPPLQNKRFVSRWHGTPHSVSDGHIFCSELFFAPKEARPARITSTCGWVAYLERWFECSSRVTSGLHGIGKHVLRGGRKETQYVRNCYLHAAKIDT